MSNLVVYKVAIRLQTVDTYRKSIYGLHKTSFRVTDICSLDNITMFAHLMASTLFYALYERK
jgi:hypothetical protein